MELQQLIEIFGMPGVLLAGALWERNRLLKQMEQMQAKLDAAAEKRVELMQQHLDGAIQREVSTLTYLERITDKLKELSDQR